MGKVGKKMIKEIAIKAAKKFHIYEVYVNVWKRTIGKKYDDVYYVWNHRESKISVDRIVNENSDSVLHLCENKKIYIVGCNRLTRALIEFLNRHGRIVSGIIADSSERNDMYDNYIDIDDLVCEDPVTCAIIVTTKINTYKKVSDIIDFGFSNSNIFVFDIDKTRGTKGKECYEVQLGYTREDDWNGFTIFGDKNSTYKIVTLGGSTTDATCSGLRSWSEILYSLIKDRFPDVSIYCAGMGSFSSSQEFIKFYKDVIPLKPDIVISYSGFNDIYLEYIDYNSSDDRYVCNYQVDFLDKALEKGIVNSYNPIIGVKKIVTAQNACRSVQDHWICNERMMKAICEEYGIRFFSYFQPCRIYEEGKINETDIPTSSIERYEFVKSLYNLQYEAIEYFRDAYNSMKELLRKEENQFVKDISDIFERESDVYTDECHVYEKGNRIIAREVLRDIESYIPVKE